MKTPKQLKKQAQFKDSSLENKQFEVLAALFLAICRRSKKSGEEAWKEEVSGITITVLLSNKQALEQLGLSAKLWEAIAEKHVEVTLFNFAARGYLEMELGGFRPTYWVTPKLVEFYENYEAHNS